MVGALGPASTLGITSRAGAEEDDDGAEELAATGVSGVGVYGAGLSQAPAATGDDQVDEWFIATAAEGTIDHPHVVQLRAFRDEALRSSGPGRLFIKTYSTLSPRIAEWIARSARRRRWTRRLLVRPLARAVTTANLTASDTIHNE